MGQVTSSRVMLLGVENIDGSVTGVTAGTSQPVDYSMQGVVAFYLRSIGTTSGGTVLIEEADWGPQETPYGGTWSTVATIAASSFTGGAEIAYHIIDSAYGYLRVRISSAITGGGTITAAMRSRGAM